MKKQAHSSPSSDKVTDVPLPPSPARGEGVLRQRAKKMRKTMTPAERKLWYALRGRRLARYKFRRQVPLGNYIVDFACFNPKLIVEVDGGQHSESEYDQRRDKWLALQGFPVLRFWNPEVMTNLVSVTETIYTKLRARNTGAE